jgi:hypothetical protein
MLHGLLSAPLYTGPLLFDFNSFAGVLSKRVET